MLNRVFFSGVSDVKEAGEWAKSQGEAQFPGSSRRRPNNLLKWTGTLGSLGLGGASEMLRVNCRNLHGKAAAAWGQWSPACEHLGETRKPKQARKKAPQARKKPQKRRRLGDSQASSKAEKEAKEVFLLKPALRHNRQLVRFMYHKTLFQYTHSFKQMNSMLEISLLTTPIQFSAKDATNISRYYWNFHWRVNRNRYHCKIGNRRGCNLLLAHTNIDQNDNDDRLTLGQKECSMITNLKICLER